MEAFTALLAHPVIPRLGWSLVHFLWQAALLALLLAIILRLLRQRSPNSRYLACTGTLLLMALAVPITTCCLPAAPQTREAVMPPPLPIAAPVTEAPPAAAAESSELFFAASPRPAGELPTQTASSPTPRPLAEPWHVRTFRALDRVMPYAVLAWLAGVTLLSVRLTAGWIVVQRLKRRYVEPAGEQWNRVVEKLAQRMAVSRPVQIVRSSLAQVPSTIGWLRPVILMPAAALTGMSREQLEAIIAHELAHIRRYDYLVNLAQSVIETLLFYHPAVWWVSRRMRTEREHCCDDMAVAACGNAVTYARALSELESIRGTSRLLAAASGGSLVDRVRRILGVKAPHSDAFARWAAGLLVVMVVVAFFAVTEISSSRALAGADAAPPPATAPADEAADEPGEEPSTMTAQPHRWRHFVRVVVGPDSLTFEGRLTSWEHIGEGYGGAAYTGGYGGGMGGWGRSTDPKQTVLELARESEQVPADVYEQAQAKALELVARKGYEYLSEIGVAPLNSTGSKSHYLPPLTQRGRWRHFIRHIAGVGIVDAKQAGGPAQVFSIPEDIIRSVSRQLPEPQWTVLELAVAPNTLDPQAYAEIKQDLEAEAKQAGLEGVIDRGVQAVDAPASPSVFVANASQPGYWRHYVTLVVGPDRMTFQGEPVTAGQLAAKLAGVPNKPDTVLCIATTSDKVNREAVRRQLNAALRGVAFNHISWVGVHPLGTKGEPSVFFPTSGPATTRAVDESGQAGISARLLRDPERPSPTLHLTIPGEMLTGATNDELANTFKPLLEGEPSLKFDTPATKPVTVAAMVNAGKTGLLSGTVVYLRAKNIFYVWGYDTFSSKASPDYHFYGPFPAGALKPLDWNETTENAPQQTSPTTQPASGSAAANRFLPKGLSSRPADGGGEGGPAGEVVTPDGKPAANALVLLVPPRAEGFAFSCQFLNGGIGDARNSLATQTRSDGRFTFGEQEPTFQLVVLHDSGFAHVTMEAFEASSRIRLAAWARIEGRILIGGKPGKREKAVLERQITDIASPISIQFRNEATCDDEGRFVMERVAPILSFVGREVTITRARSSSMVFDHAVAVEPEPGKTATVTVGGSGHRVTGRVLGADGKPADFSKAYALGDLVLPRPSVKLPVELTRLRQDEQIAFFTRWLTTDDGKAFQQAHTFSPIGVYYVPINDDGTFSVEDVPDGDYTLRVWVTTLNEGPAWGQGEPIGTVNALVEVDAEPQAEGKPIDLGTFELKPPPQSARRQTSAEYTAVTETGAARTTPE